MEQNKDWSLTYPETETMNMAARKAREETYKKNLPTTAAIAEYEKFWVASWSKYGRYLEWWSIATSIGIIGYDGINLDIDGYKQSMNGDEAFRALTFILKLEKYVIPGWWDKSIIAELNKTTSNPSPFTVEWWKLIYGGLIKNITIYSGSGNILSEEQLQVMAWRMNERYRKAYDIKLAENIEKQDAEYKLHNLA